MQKDHYADLVARIRDLSAELRPEPTGVTPRLTPLQGIRAVLFDIYGTLMISASGDIGTDSASSPGDDAFRTAFASVGIDPGLLRDTSGAGLLEDAVRSDHSARRAAGTEYPEVDILVIWQRVLDSLPGGAVRLPPRELERLALEYECRSNPVWPMPGLAELLRGLRTAGMHLGLVSNAQFYTPLLFDAFAEAPLQQLGFDPTLCLFSYRRLEAKPSTALYREAIAGLARLGCGPGQALYLGNDMLKDIWPAASCGLRTALFAGDARSLRLRDDDRRCRETEPDLVLTDLRQLLRVLSLGEVVKHVG